MTNSTLSNRWHQLTAPLLPDEATRTATYEQLSAAYSASDRHYHTLHHVRALLDVAERHTSTLQDPMVVQLAIWFHDAVYSARRSDNEERSARLALDFLEKTSLSTKQRQRVAYLIERTKDHTQPISAPDADLAFFLDADLQILGAPEADYWQYARQIRQEYRLIPDMLYRPGRRKVLEKMLAAPTLYRTPEFRQRLEDTARRNLRLELADL
ncbi:metal-dependent phosphohydrolase [Hymenobacter sp. BT507]|uniref:Metal-dependent phosphohydrolase n=1 Tax=Hymenobacter citatus TaxID=2763506 RepID=A0ABR7MLA8_9BACT|nr:metal-dependent phosphohydrolase [Hymenobacter citatus]MBC6611876.1 metal-dependent phosphohydrolase [Hymenobacter citatus]